MSNRLPSVVNDLEGQGFSIQDNFLPRELYQNLLADIDHAKLIPARIGKGNLPNVNESIRSDKIAWLEQNTLTSAEESYLKTMEDLRLAINQTLFLGLFDFEAHYAVYAPGSFYQKHVDQFRQNTTRQISVIYYLNDDWQSSAGGELKLYDSQDNLLQTIAPMGNRLVCFLSDSFPHEVCVTQQIRKSITGWFRRRQ